MKRLLKLLLPLAASIIGIAVSARFLSEELSIGALLLLLLSLLLLLFALLRPLFIRRGRARSGLPSRYERIPDPWRALDKGKDPTDT